MIKHSLKDSYGSSATQSPLLALGAREERTAALILQRVYKFIGSLVIRWSGARTAVEARGEACDGGFVDEFEAIHDCCNVALSA